MAFSALFYKHSVFEWISHGYEHAIKGKTCENQLIHELSRESGIEDYIWIFCMQLWEKYVFSFVQVSVCLCVKPFHIRTCQLSYSTSYHREQSKYPELWLIGPSSSPASRSHYGDIYQMCLDYNLRRDIVPNCTLAWMPTRLNVTYLETETGNKYKTLRWQQQNPRKQQTRRRLSSERTGLLFYRNTTPRMFSKAEYPHKACHKYVV